MIYIFTLVVLVVLIIRFDYKYVGEKRNNFDNHVLTRYDLWYGVMLIWFICVSGFAYNVGSDITIYMREYNNFGGIWKVNTFSDILKFDNRQPGWVLLNVICASISRNFVLLKLVIAIFVNWTVFRFLRRHTKYVFTGIFFYAVILYLSLNFNALKNRKNPPELFRKIPRKPKKEKPLSKSFYSPKYLWRDRRSRRI